MSDAWDVLADLWKDAGGLPACLQQVTLNGSEPVLPSSFRVGTAAQVSIAAAGLAAGRIHRSRGGQAQEVRVDMRHAAVEFKSERHFRVDNRAPPSLWDAIAGIYRCGDGQ